VAKIVSDLTHAVQDATKLRFIHRVCRCGKREIQIIQFGVLLVALETVAQTSPLVKVVPTYPIKFIRGGFGRRNENVDGE
jgi:hypothetical protein